MPASATEILERERVVHVLGNVLARCESPDQDKVIDDVLVGLFGDYECDERGLIVGMHGQVYGAAFGRDEDREAINAARKFLDRTHECEEGRNDG